MALTPEQKALLEDLIGLHRALRDETRETYGRINPFHEDLFDWKERGAYWCGADRNVTIYNSTTVLGEVEIGRNTWIGPYCSLDGTGGIVIGEHCSISLGTQILTHDTVRWALSGGTAPYDYGPVQIGNCCFIGTFSVITRGTTIGNHCLVGAGSVVTRNVPDCSIVGGTPAEIIGRVEIDMEGDVCLVYDK